MKNYTYKRGYLTLFAVLLITITSCKKSLEVDPPSNSVNLAEPIVNTVILDKMVNNIYGQCSNALFAFGGFSRGLEIMADNYQSGGTAANFLREQSLTLDPLGDSWVITNPYASFYKTIYAANKLVEVLKTTVPNANLPQSRLTQAMVDAYACRAISYYFLGRLWGNVPLLITSDVIENNTIGQSNQAAVFAQVEKDLLAARALAVAAAPTTTVYVRTQNQINSLLAKLYLRMGRWADASTAASALISDPNYTFTTLDLAYMQKSTETIVGFGNTSAESTGNGTKMAYCFIGFRPYPGSGTTMGYATTDLLNSYEAGDQRKVKWFEVLSGVTYQKKYLHDLFYYIDIFAVPSGQEQNAVFTTLAEMYLIRAEAKANLNDLSGAAKDVNMVRTRAGLSNLPAITDKTIMINAILKERRLELNPSFGERWDDLCRHHLLLSVLGDATKFPNKAANLNAGNATQKELLPLPTTEIQKNPKLVQNPGWN